MDFLILTGVFFLDFWILIVNDAFGMDCEILIWFWTDVFCMDSGISILIFVFLTVIFSCEMIWIHVSYQDDLLFCNLNFVTNYFHWADLFHRLSFSTNYTQEIDS